MNSRLVAQKIVSHYSLYAYSYYTHIVYSTKTIRFYRAEATLSGVEVKGLFHIAPRAIDSTKTASSHTKIIQTF